MAVLKPLALALCVLAELAAETLSLPARQPDAPNGTTLARRWAEFSLRDREAAILAEIKAGNVPAFLREPAPVSISQRTDDGATATLQVAPDYLAVGSDEDYLFTPLTPSTAQQLADDLDCILPTPQLVDAIFQAAPLKLPPAPIAPTPAMTTMPVFHQHSLTLLAQRRESIAQHAPGVLVAGHKKDVVISPDLAANPGKVAIYGWHRAEGTAIQPLYAGHTDQWVDYSHGIRLVAATARVNGVERKVAELLADPAWADVLSDGRPIAQPRYAASTPIDPFAGFTPAPAFREETLTFRHEPGVRIHLLAPARDDFKPNKPVDLLIYALPNGSTIEHTLGRAVPPGVESKFNLQHLAAQTRFLRARFKDRNIVLACVEAKGLSWPAWRKKHGDAPIPRIVQTVRARFAGSLVRLTLSAHSGGGSFIFGYINAHEVIPDDVVRIAFLDANYGYLPDKHTLKLANWLNASRRHYLCVLAYRDDLARWQGKPFVTASGGTGGRTKLMQADLAHHFKLRHSKRGDLRVARALGGRAQFLLHENPAGVILHTVQVELNGFIHSMLTGTSEEGNDYDYLGPRAYERWIERASPP